MAVTVFLYGGLIHPSVRARVGLAVLDEQQGSLPGYELTITPWVNLIARPGEMSFGLLVSCEHKNLVAAYAQLMVRYDPYAVLALDHAGRALPAICYLASDMPEGEVEASHVWPLVDAAKDLGFPAWYQRKIASFIV